MAVRALLRCRARSAGFRHPDCRHDSHCLGTQILPIRTKAAFAEEILAVWGCHHANVRDASADRLHSIQSCLSRFHLTCAISKRNQSTAGMTRCTFRSQDECRESHVRAEKGQHLPMWSSCTHEVMALQNSSRQQLPASMMGQQHQNPPDSRGHNIPPPEGGGGVWGCALNPHNGQKSFAWKVR